MDIIQANYNVYAKYVSQFHTYSVKELREIAVRMNVSGRSTMKKGELAHSIAMEVLSWADEAFDENVKRTYTQKGTVVRERQIDRDSRFTGLSFMDRVAGYHSQNGTERSKRLTAKQQKRAAKKFKRAISKGISLERATGR